MNITTIDQLTNDFNLELDNIPETNKIQFINNEIKEIEKHLEPKEQNKLDKKNRFANLTLKPNFVFKISIPKKYKNYFINAFNDYHLRQKVVSNENSEIQIVLLQAYEFVKYYNWLIELTSNNKNQIKKKSTLTHAQKILALYYLGIDMRKFQNNVKSAKILSSILDLDESNTKDYLTYFEGKKSKVKNKKNIDKMIELFEHQDFKSILDKIKEES